MDHFVNLPSLPSDLRAIPVDLVDRFRYDETAHQLRFAGFMSKGDFDRLTQLSDSWPYKRAVESLFQLSTIDDEEAATRLRGLRRILASIGMI